MLRIFFILSLIFIVIKCDCLNSKYADYVFHINGHDIDWPCESTKNIYLQTKLYIPKNIVATRAQIHKNTGYIVMTRYKDGIPVTLGQVKLKKDGCHPKITPYPSLAMQEEGNCTALQSAVDVFVDKAGILWVLDSGRVEILIKPVDRCPPKIVAINTLNGHVIQRIDLSKLIVPKSKLQFVVAEYSPSGDPFVYVADTEGAVIVYDVESKNGYRVILPDEIKSNKTEDVLFMVLAYSQNRTANCKYQDNSLYLSYLSSTQLYAIQTNLLHNANSKGAIIDVGKKPFALPMVILGSNNADKLYFRFKGQNNLYDYDVTACFNKSNFKLIYTGGDCRFAVHALTGSGNYVWTIENNFIDYVNGTTGCYGASVVLQPVSN